MGIQILSGFSKDLIWICSDSKELFASNYMDLELQVQSIQNKDLDGMIRASEYQPSIWIDTLLMVFGYSLGCGFGPAQICYRKRIGMRL